MISAPIMESKLLSLIYSNNIVNISGESGTGKTSLALYVVGKLLTLQKPYDQSCIWIQASEVFPKRRLNSLFRSNDKSLEYLENNIYVIPKEKAFSSYAEQVHTLRSFIATESQLPPDVHYIVIDNISHHLRLELSVHSEVQDVTNSIDYFYDEVLSPLLFYCIRERIHLILVHEVSYDMNTRYQKSFLHKLYSRLDGVHIHLLKLFHTEKKLMKISRGKALWELFYRIEKSGFVWL